MKRVPGNREVDKALTAAARRVAAALKALNQEAARLLGRGDYDAAMAMMETGKQISLFRDKLACLKDDWRELVRAKRRPREEKTPLWRYYQPVAKALVQLGGRARRRDIEGAVQPLLQSQLKPGDLAVSSRGVARWQTMLRRARKAMVHEGFLEFHSGLEIPL